MKYVYPFNRGIPVDKDVTFSVEGGDLASGDEVIFTRSDSCEYLFYDTSVKFTRDINGDHGESLL